MPNRKDRRQGARPGQKTAPVAQAPAAEELELQQKTRLAADAAGALLPPGCGLILIAVSPAQQTAYCSTLQTPVALRVLTALDTTLHAQLRGSKLTLVK